MEVSRANPPLSTMAYPATCATLTESSINPNVYVAFSDSTSQIQPCFFYVALSQSKMTLARSFEEHCESIPPASVALCSAGGSLLQQAGNDSFASQYRPG